MENNTYELNDELTHWGIKGMRWGIRRYQNKDGSLTPAGKKRLKAETDKVREQEQINKNRKATRAKLDRLAARKKAAEDEKKALDDADNADRAKTKKGVGDNKSATKLDKKSIKDMSDEELATAINRARMEDAYRQLRPEPVVEKHPFMKKLVNDVVAPAAINAGKQFLENALKQAGNNLLKGKADSDSVEALTKTRDKLKLKNEINKLKKGKSDDDDDLSWDDKIKKQTYERNKKKYDAEDAAEEAAKKGKKEAEEAAKKAKKEAKDRERETEKYNEYQEQYRRSIDIDSSSPYRSRGGERTSVNSNSNNSRDNVLALPSSVSDTPVTALSTTVVSRGRSATDNYSGWNSGVSDTRNRDSANRGREIFNEDGSLYGYWSGMKDGLNGTF